jgi:hypothetical protein
MAAPRDHDVAAIAPAQRVEYLVRPEGDGWIIARNGDEYGPYENRRDAMFFAVDAAHKVGEQGSDATVRLMDAAGQPVAAWTHGTDPYFSTRHSASAPSPRSRPSHPESVAFG